MSNNRCWCWQLADIYREGVRQAPSQALSFLMVLNKVLLVVVSSLALIRANCCNSYFSVVVPSQEPPQIGLHRPRYIKLTDGCGGGGYDGHDAR